MELCASNYIATVWTGSLFYSSMTVSLCIKHGSKRNDDSVSVEELDRSAETQLNTSGVTLNTDLEPKTHQKLIRRGIYSIYIYIYAFSRRFYPKRLTVHSGYTFVLSVCCQYLYILSI